MHIKILKSSNAAYWYTKAIGVCFDISEEQLTDDIKEPSLTQTDLIGRSILRGDCEVEQTEQKNKPHHGNKWMPVLYACYYGILKDIAHEYGYALAIHGSLTRDFDLIAVPWIENPKDHLEMLDKFAEALGTVRFEGKPYNSCEQKPHNRMTYTIPSGGGGYLDISIIVPQSFRDIERHT